MADIRQAVEWCKDGHSVQRAKYAGKVWMSSGVPWFFLAIGCADGGEHILDGFDLLADDWEIVER
jgi:hypothetical protein